ncbi:unnamed protein product, partial [Ixodes hexagonus]
QDCGKLGRVDDVPEGSGSDLYSPCSPSPPPQNGNCRPDEGDSPIKGPASRNMQNVLVSSSDSDDDDVIRAVKETLGVRTHKPRLRNVRGTLSRRPPPKPPVFPTIELPCDASDSDSEGKLMIAESPVSPESSPQRNSEDGETNLRLAEDPSGPKAPPEDSDTKSPRSMDDMPLFTIKFTRTKSGAWVMVRPQSEDSDAGDEATPRKRPPTRRRRVAAPKKARDEAAAKSMFDSSDDEPLSELRNRGATTTAPPVLRDADDNAAGDGSANHTNTLSDLERKLEDVEKRRSNGRKAGAGPPAKKRRKKVSRLCSLL